jgi:hypothetical protein
MAFDPNDLKFRAALKAYVALFGAVVTALLGVLGDSTLTHTLTALAAVATAVGVWLAQNPADVVVVQPDVSYPEPQDDGQPPLV